jgi:tetratricopeptide (TPR) repeat protein
VLSVTGRVRLLILLATAACRSRTEAPAAAPAAAPRPAGPRSGPGATPRARTEFPTTSGDLALSNLDSLIEGAEKASAGKGDVAGTSRWVSLLLLRGQIRGRIADYERADHMAAALVAGVPGSPAAQRTLASVHATLHRFSAASAALSRAEKLGENPLELESARAALREATGRTSDALPVREREAASRPDMATLTALATARADLGDREAARRLFVRAQDEYRDPSPFPLAHLYLQEGLAAERAGELARARDLFAAAIERVPGFAPATGHLAGVLASTGQRRRAIALLQSLLESSDDPEYVGQLADLLRTEHRDSEADQLFHRADARFTELTRRLPEAYADHASRFYLTWGGHNAQALALARRNLAERPTRTAMALATQAATAAGDSRLACTIAARLAAEKPLGPNDRVLAARAFEGCGRESDAQTLLAAAPPGR